MEIQNNKKKCIKKYNENLNSARELYKGDKDLTSTLLNKIIKDLGVERISGIYDVKKYSNKSGTPVVYLDKKEFEKGDTILVIKVDGGRL